MAAVKAQFTHLVAGGTGQAWLFSGQSNSLEVDLSGNSVEDTRFQDAARTFVTLEPEGTISQQGYFDNGGAGNFEQEMAEAIANSETWHVGASFGTAITACPTYVSDTTSVANLNISSPVDGLITASGEWANGIGVKRGLRVFQGVISATGNTTHIDLGAVGNGGFAYLWVYNNTGTMTNSSLKMQADDNTGFTTPTDLATFTFSARGAYKATIVGTIDRYIRLTTTTLGGATNFTVVAVIVASGVTQGVA